jgi:hypothetical protein
MVCAIPVSEKLEEVMENAPVININFLNIAPGADDEIVKRYHKWITEVYHTMQMKIAGITGIDRYEIVRKNPEYPSICTIIHLKNIAAYENVVKTSEVQAVVEDLKTWVKRAIREGIWSVIYELVQSFRPITVSSGGERDTRIENAPIMHLEAYWMTPEEQEKFSKWFDVYSRVFIPLFMRNCGLKGYDYFKFCCLGENISMETQYPPYISVLHFENLKAFDEFERSSEMVSFQSALRNILPFGLNYRRYVQYQLTNSLRK